MTKEHIMAFEDMARTSYCIFAAHAKLVFGPLMSGIDISQNLEEVFQSFIEFDKISLDNNLDAFILSFNHANILQDPEMLMRVGSSLLNGLVIRDMGEAEGKEFISNAGEENWWYKFNGNRYFVICFAPCFPTDSPRHIEYPYAFFMFQPVHSFDRKAVPKGGKIPQKARDKIREAYNKSGKKYDFKKAQSAREGEKIFAGLIGNENLMWWKI